MDGWMEWAVYRTDPAQVMVQTNTGVPRQNKEWRPVGVNHRTPSHPYWSWPGNATTSGVTKVRHGPVGRSRRVYTTYTKSCSYPAINPAPFYTTTQSRPALAFPTRLFSFIMKRRWLSTSLTHLLIVVRQEFLLAACSSSCARSISHSLSRALRAFTYEELLPRLAAPLLIQPYSIITCCRSSKKENRKIIWFLF